MASKHGGHNGHHLSAGPQPAGTLEHTRKPGYRLLRRQRIQDRAVRCVTAVTSGDQPGERGFQTLQVVELAPDIAPMGFGHLRDLPASVIAAVDHSEQAANLFETKAEISQAQS